MTRAVGAPNAVGVDRPSLAPARARERPRARRPRVASTRARDAGADAGRDAGAVTRRERTPTGGAARSFVGASFYEDPYDTRGGGAARGLATARELASARRGLSGPMSQAARRAKGAMRPADGAKKRNRAEEAIERRRAIERDMRAQVLEVEVKREVESLVKQRAKKALECERVELRDGSVLFKFKVRDVPQVTVEETERVALEVERRLWGDTQTNENIVARWLMTVRYLASTFSVENAVVYVASTPFRVLFWSLAYALRSIFWIVTGRGSVRPSARAKRQLKQINTVVSTGPERGFNPFGSVKSRPNWRAA